MTQGEINLQNHIYSLEKEELFLKKGNSDNFLQLEKMLNLSKEIWNEYH